MNCRRWMGISVLAVVWFLGSASLGALDPPPEQTSTECTFDDGKEVSIRYTPASSNEKLPKNDVWTPGGSPAFLFSQTDLTLGASRIPVGAYSLYFIPAKGKWTLIVNKGVNAGAKYDAQQDVARAAMDTAELGHPADRLKVVLVKAAPQECNVRIYFGKTGAYGANFQEP